MRVTPQEAAARWRQGAANNVSRFQDGVRRVNQSPGAAAAQQVNKYQTNVQASIQKWQQRVGSVSLADWQQRTADVGGQRYSQGVAASENKMADFMTQFGAHLDAGVARVKGMPSTTLEDRINRSVAMMRHNATFQRR